MAYIWINPVAAGMYEQDALNDFTAALQRRFVCTHRMKASHHRNH